MASRLLNRRELRKQADQAEGQQPETAEGAEAAESPLPKKKLAKAKAPAKPKKPRKKKAPARLCARWGVFDNSMKQVAIFDYNQRDQAEQKVADLRAQKNTTNFFLQIVKEPMPEPEPILVEPV